MGTPAPSSKRAPGPSAAARAGVGAAGRAGRCAASSASCPPSYQPGAPPVGDGVSQASPEGEAARGGVERKLLAPPGGSTSVLPQPGPPPGPRDARAVQASLSASERGVAQTSPECHAAPAPQARHRLPRRGRRWELPPPPAGPLQKARCLWRDPPTPELTSVRALSTAGDRKPSSNWLKKRGA